MARGTNVPITPAVLNWAMAESGYSTSDLASRMGLASETVSSWQAGTTQPLLSQFNLLVSVLKRPTATFFLAEPPERQAVHIEFRGPKEQDHRPLSHKELQLVRQAHNLQKNLSWLNKEFEEKRPRLAKASIGSNVETVAEDIRTALNVGIARQLGWASPSEAFKQWRSATEELGVFVFLFPMGRESCRGFSLHDAFAPVIAINTAWNTEARIFTLFHELGHLVTRTDSACKHGGNYVLTSKSDKTERWCEKLAASILLPWNPVKRYIIEKHEWSSGQKIRSLDVVYGVAGEFKTSARAAAIRLIQKGAADWTLYRQIPAISDDKKPQGGGHGRGRQEISEANFGLKTANLLGRATDEKYLTIADAVDYLRISDADFRRMRKAQR